MRSTSVRKMNQVVRQSIKFKLILVFFPILFLQNGLAQINSRQGLPEGAVARFGKGWLQGHVAYSPDGTRLAVAGSIGVWLYDAESGEKVNLLPGHTGRITSVAFSPDGRMLAIGETFYRREYEASNVRLWDMVIRSLP